MSSSCALHRLPRAGVDPIDSEHAALSMLTFVMHEPARHETIVLLLDSDRRGFGVLVVSGTIPFDAIFDVLDVIVELDVDELGAVVVASVRPPAAQGGDLDEHDVDRWLEATAMLDERGLELLEWFVIGRDVSCPRDVFGEPPRW